MSNISQNLINAMGIIAENAVKKAGYDKTIQVQILSCQDQAQGKYRCRFQDAVFYAYSNNPQVTYTSGSFVYVLVPGNDMSGKKNIVGSTQQLGVNYIPTIEADEYLDPIGINCVQHSGIYYLDSNNKNYKYDIYTSNNITLDAHSLDNYIKRSSYILLGANFKTNLNAERQYRGHFGITFKLVFNDNATGAQVIRTFTIDQDNMVGNPYRLLNSRQYQIFPIDGANFVRFAGIEIFNSDFPNANGNITTGLLNNGDIIIQSIEIQGANKLSQQELNGVAITFYTPNGTFFNNQSLEGSSKQITAQIRIKGKLTDSKKIPFYWGIQNIGITPNSVFYNKYLGRGWKCLNNFNTIVQQIEQQGEIIKEEIIQWIPNSNTYYFKKEDATAKQNKIKVAILYQNNIIYKQISIQNLSNNISNITIESDEGETFYLDFGTPSLTCKVDNVEQLSNNYEYFWGMVSNTGMLISLDQTTQYNNIFQTTQARINILKAQSSLTNAEKIQLEEKLTLIKDYNLIQRVNKNKVIKVQINTITNFAIFKCSVYKDGKYLGTGSIKLVNFLQNPDGGYSLIIENGSAVFKYDENGAAPNNKSLQNPIEIKALDFVLYDSFGQIIQKQNIIGVAGTEIKWQVPVVNTMIEIPSELQLQPDQHDQNVESVFYSNIPLPFVYQIASKYNPKKQNNQIKLHLKYKNINMIASTQFMFMKQGQDGSNGTEYVVKILPNTTMSNPPLYPVITKTGSSSTMQLNYNIGGSLNTQFLYNNSQQLFKAQLWHSGELIWEGSLETDGTFYNGQNLNNNLLNSITWEVLSNKYGTDKSDDTLLQIDSTYKNKIKLKTDSFLNSNQITSLANIIKCTIIYDEKQYYATIPIIFAWVNDSDYRFYLKENSGYKYVIYSQDGQSPQYDSSEPFEFIYQPKIQYNIQYPNIDQINRYTYQINIYGDTQRKVKRNNSWVWQSLNSLQLTQPKNRDQNLQRNQFNFIPSARYNGQCVNNGIVCTCKENGIVKARIYVPIHFYLNRYAFSHLNGWDGNSIQINEQGGYILSPQIGAGIKDLNNRFTGVLMGEVKDPNKGKINSGLLGYYSGARTFFVNSENGSAIFGKSNAGQIVIDPTQDKAMLYSGNYWKSDGYDEITGLPRSYGDNNENGQGLLIDLTTPCIKYGNGNFSVDQNGHLIAKNGGQIAGWKIGAQTLESVPQPDENGITDSSDKITLTTVGKIYSGNHSGITSTSNGFCLTKNGLSIGSKFRVTSEGILRIGRGAVSNSSNSQKFWTIDGSDSTGQSFIKYNNKNDSNSVYLGTDGIWLGKNFSVTNDGTLLMKKGSITLGYSNNSEKGFSVDSSGNLSIGTNFNVSSSGNLQAKNVELSGSVRSQKTSGTGYIELKSGVLRGGWGSSSHGDIDFTYQNSYDGSNSIQITANLIRFNADNIGVYRGTSKSGRGTLAINGSMCGISFINGIATELDKSYGQTGYIYYTGANGGTGWLYFNNGVLTGSG